MIEWVVSSCVLILLVEAVRQLFRKRLDLKVRYALWLVVAVRLLLPIWFAQSSVSVLNLLEMWENSRTEEEEPLGGFSEMGDVGLVNPDAAFGGHEGVPAAFEENGNAPAAFGENGNVPAAFRENGNVPVAFGENGNAPAAFEENGDASAAFGENGNALASFEGSGSGGQKPIAPDGQRQATQSAMESLYGSFVAEFRSGRFLLMVWGAGSLLCGMMFLVANLKDSRRRRSSRVFFPWEGESKLTVYVSEAVQTPCMAGLFRPAIYLTGEVAEDGKQLSFVIAHENMHYNHGDHLWAMVRVICLCVHWYNPLVWLAAHLSRQDGELACDADVLKHFGREERVEYGKALLELSIQRDGRPMSLSLATTLSGGKRQLRERLAMIRERPKRTIGVLAAVAVLVAAMFAATFTGGKKTEISGERYDEGNQVTVNKISTGNSDLMDPPVAGNLSLGYAPDDSAKVSSPSPEPEAQPGEASMFGYNDYTGYLDECVRWIDYRKFVEQDYDGDGTKDRVWRENIQSWGVADYHIEFGNGDKIELPMTAGGIPMVRTLDLEGDGVKEILFTESFSYTTDPRTFGQMALFRKTEKGYEMMELPGGLTQVASGERDTDGTMLRYRPKLSFLYEEADRWTMRVTCPDLEDMEGLEPLDVTVDFTHEEWEMRSYGERYLSSGSALSVVPYQVDVVSLGNGCDSLQLRFSMLDAWCDDEVVVTLWWEDGDLQIEDIRYWHEYIEAVYADIGGEPYELILKGSGFVGGNQYTIDSIQVVHFRYDDGLNGVVEDRVQVIDPGQEAKQYWSETDISGGSGLGAAVSDSRDGNILVKDLNFDGKEDFCIQGWIPAGSNIPYYCYVWNEGKGRFEYSGWLSNVETDEKLKRVYCPVYEGSGVYGTQYYRYVDGAMVMERYVKKDTSPDAIFDSLDLTCVETSYSMSRENYMKNATRIFLLAEQALTELYQITGTKVEASCFAVAESGIFFFALTEEDLKKGKSYYDRCFGGQGIFWDTIPQLTIADEMIGFAPDVSPVEHFVAPPGLDSMADEEVVQWYFENSPFAQVSRLQFGNTILKAGDKLDTIEESFEGDYILKTKSGKYYELTYNRKTRTVNAYYGPYESYPTH